jgi:hypothetical protein
MRFSRGALTSACYAGPFLIRNIATKNIAQEAGERVILMPMDFLLSHFTLLGVDLQWWMPILGV